MKIVRFNLLGLFFLSVLLGLLTSCSTKVSYKGFNHHAQLVVKDGEKLINEGRLEEGIKMLQVAKQVYPDDPVIHKLEKKIPEDFLKTLEVNPLFGHNKGKLRAKITPTKTEKILWYLPDRIKDLVDIVTYEGSVGPQLGLGYWATRAVQAEAFVGTTLGVGYYQKTCIGYRAEANSELVLGPVGASAVAGSRIGLTGFANTADTVGFHTPSDELYQEYRDYWAFGAKIGILLVGGEIEVHPLEFVDFFAGIFGIDFLDDDLATTRHLKLTRAQRKKINLLSKMIRSYNDIERAELLSEYPTIFSNNNQLNSLLR